MSPLGLSLLWRDWFLSAILRSCSALLMILHSLPGNFSRFFFGLRALYPKISDSKCILEPPPPRPLPLMVSVFLFIYLFIFGWLILQLPRTFYVYHIFCVLELNLVYCYWRRSIYGKEKELSWWAVISHRCPYLWLVESSYVFSYTLMLVVSSLLTVCINGFDRNDLRWRKMAFIWDVTIIQVP